MFLLLPPFQITIAIYIHRTNYGKFLLYHDSHEEDKFFFHSFGDSFKLNLLNRTQQDMRSY